MDLAPISWIHFQNLAQSRHSHTRCSCSSTCTLLALELAHTKNQLAFTTTILLLDRLSSYFAATAIGRPPPFPSTMPGSVMPSDNGCSESNEYSFLSGSSDGLSDLSKSFNE